MTQTAIESRISKPAYTINPWAIDTLKLVAFTAMLLDHANLILGLDIPILHSIGRCAFPLFGIVWAHNVVMNEDRFFRQRAINQMWIWACIAQIFYYSALGKFGWLLYDANILFCFAAASQASVWLKEHRSFTLTVVMICAVAYMTDRSEYGFYGFFFLFACYLFFSIKPENKMKTMAAAALILHCCMNLNRTPELSFAGTMLTMVSLLFVLAIPDFRLGRYLPGKSFYIAYCAHLGALALIARWGV